MRHKHFIVLIITMLTLSFFATEGQPSAFQENKESELLEQPLSMKLYDLINSFEGLMMHNKPWAQGIYNEIRDLLHQPHAQSFQEIDHQWINEVKEAINPYLSVDRFAVETATPAQRALVEEEAKKILGLEHKITAFSHGTLAGAETWSTMTGPRRLEREYYIALCKNPDLDFRLAVLYHELAHIYYDDPLKSTLVADSKSKDYVEKLINDPEFKVIREAITTFIEGGKKALNTSTALGKKINETLAHNSPLWIAPTDIHEYQNMIWYRGAEQRADIFSFGKLFEHKKLNAMLQRIEHYGMSDYITAQGSEDEHPSHFERTLYLLGYLVGMGIDVNKAFEEWENSGVCIPAEEFNPYEELISPALKLTKGAQDFLKAYALWQKEKQKADYERWKAELNQEFELRDLNFYVRLLYLLRATQSLIIKGQTHPEAIAEKNILYHYNFAREMRGQSLVSSSDYIDQQWIIDQISAVRR